MSIDHQRIRFTLSYDGTFFRGWATQPKLRTVQGVFEQALGTICRQPIAVSVAGRTDAGVHAFAQVAHADIPGPVWDKLYQAAVVTPQPSALSSPVLEAGQPPEGDTWGELSDVETEYELRNADLAAYQACHMLMRRLNSLLARDYGTWMAERGTMVARGTSDVLIYQAQAVNDDFDARFSAESRTYCYRVQETGMQLQPLSRRNTWWISGHLDQAAMKEAARPLLGEHDFLSFCKPREGATTIRTLRRLDVESKGNAVEFWVNADAFCHSMVRSLVGALVEVGLGRRGVSWPGELLALRSRQQAAPLAPPQGLTLNAVTYPHPSRWRARQNESRARREPCCGDEV